MSVKIPEPFCTKEKDDKPIPIRRKDVEELALNITIHFDNFLNFVLCPAADVINNDQIAIAKRFIESMMDEWCEFEFDTVRADMKAPWLNRAIAADYFNTDVVIYEDDCPEPSISLHFRTKYIEEENHAGFSTHIVYVWYEV